MVARPEGLIRARGRKPWSTPRTGRDGCVWQYRRIPDEHTQVNTAQVVNAKSNKSIFFTIIKKVGESVVPHFAPIACPNKLC